MAIALCFGGLALDASPAAAATGSANFTGYCKAKYSAPGVSVSAWHKWTGSWTAVTWRCRQQSYYPNSYFNFASLGPFKYGTLYTRDYQIDVNALCRWQYGSRAYAKLIGQSWSDWRCVY